MSFQGQSSLSLNNHGHWDKCLMIGRRQTHSCFQKRQEGGPRELQAVKPHLNLWQGHETTSAANYFQAHGRQEGD